MEPLIGTERFRDRDAYATTLILRVTKAELETWWANEEGENSNGETIRDEKEYKDVIVVEHRSLEECDNMYESEIKGTGASPLQMYLMCANILKNSGSFVDPLEVYKNVLRKLEKFYPDWKYCMATFNGFQEYYHTRQYYIRARKKRKEEKNKQKKDGENTSQERGERMSGVRRRPSLETGAGMV
jgi:hypothetical protein